MPTEWIIPMVSALNVAIEVLEREPYKDVIDDIKVLTNGDMIKAMFPKAWISNYIDFDNKCTLYIDDKMEVDMEVDIDWWNAPYKAESEDKE